MKLDEFKEVFDLKKIRNKIFKIQSMYNPNLIMNLSKEMHDRYIIRDFMCSDLLELLEQKEINIEKIKYYIKKKIKLLKKKHKNARDMEEARYLKMEIEEWKDFLT